MMARKPGRIITFYSYKGGTGRTMALSNVAWVLASNGCDVLLVDWDLEAPGLHRYLRPFLIDPELSRTPGLIDFVWEAARANMTAEGEPGSQKNEFPVLKDYVVGLDFDFEKGSISFIPAGRQDENYAQRVNTFNWDTFYQRLGGGWLLQAERERLREAYDYILIDSRTGVSDTSGICTVHMPDMLAVFFTLNRQSIKGAAAVARSVRDQRGAAFPIFAVPTRLENAERDKLSATLAYARKEFAPFLMHVQFDPSTVKPDQQANYWKDVETPYNTFYAFEEIPAAFRDESGSRLGLLAPNEGIARWITDGRVSAMQPPHDRVRQLAIEAYALKEDEAATIEWQMSARAALPIRLVRSAVAVVRSQLFRHRWQYAALAVAGFLVLLMGLQWGAESVQVEAAKRYAEQVSVAAMAAQREADAAREETKRTLRTASEMNDRAATAEKLAADAQALAAKQLQEWSDRAAAAEKRADEFRAAQMQDRAGLEEERRRLADDNGRLRSRQDELVKALASRGEPTRLSLAERALSAEAIRRFQSSACVTPSGDLGPSGSETREAIVELIRTVDRTKDRLDDVLTTKDVRLLTKLAAKPVQCK